MAPAASATAAPTVASTAPAGAPAVKSLRDTPVPSETPVAVVGPGRALIGAWIRQHLDLGAGETVRGPVLDFRRPAERIETVALRREDDAVMPDVAGPEGRVRVYTVFGRESVFTDDEGNVLGDLAGLRPDALLDTPAPPALESDEPPDPVGTPPP